jgi:aryl-alcohol dehydrogenase-like predicted oxidoreductase
VRREIDRARGLLKIDVLDAFVLHRDDRSIDVRRFLDVLSQALEEGSIRSYGLSNWTIERIDELSDQAAGSARLRPAIVSNHFSLLGFERPPWPGTEQVDRRQVLHLNTRGIRLHAWSPLASGLLCGPRDSGAWSARTGAALRTCLEVRASQLGIPTSTLALSALMSVAPNVVPIVGARTSRHIQEALDAASYVGDPLVDLWDFAESCSAPSDGGRTEN